MSNKDLLNLYTGWIHADPYLAKNTKSVYLSDVRNFIGFLGEHDARTVTPDTISLLIRHMVATGRSTSSIYRIVVSVRNFYKFLKIEGYVTENPAKGFNNQKINGMIGA